MVTQVTKIFSLLWQRPLYQDGHYFLHFDYVLPQSLPESNFNDTNEKRLMYTIILRDYFVSLGLHYFYLNFKAFMSIFLVILCTFSVSKQFKTVPDNSVNMTNESYVNRMKKSCKDIKIKGNT